LAHATSYAVVAFAAKKIIKVAKNMLKYILVLGSASDYKHSNKN